MRLPAGTDNSRRRRFRNFRRGVVHNSKVDAADNRAPVEELRLVEDLVVEDLAVEVRIRPQQETTARSNSSMSIRDSIRSPSNTMDSSVRNMASEPGTAEGRPSHLLPDNE
jgi:hypothetical protein